MKGANATEENLVKQVKNSMVQNRQRTETLRLTIAAHNWSCVWPATWGDLQAVRKELGHHKKYVKINYGNGEAVAELESQVCASRHSMRADEYVVSRIIDHRPHLAPLEVLVEWRGYGPEYNDWVVEDDLENAQEALEAYKKRKKLTTSKKRKARSSACKVDDAKKRRNSKKRR